MSWEESLAIWLFNASFSCKILSTSGTPASASLPWSQKYTSVTKTELLNKLFSQMSTFRTLFFSFCASSSCFKVKFSCSKFSNVDDRLCFCCFMVTIVESRWRTWNKNLISQRLPPYFKLHEPLSMIPSPHPHVGPPTCGWGGLRTLLQTISKSLQVLALSFILHHTEMLSSLEKDHLAQEPVISVVIHLSKVRWWLFKKLNGYSIKICQNQTLYNRFHLYLLWLVIQG